MTTVTVKNVLIEARRLLVEKGWTQRATARDNCGNYVSSRDPSAESFCMLGAVRAVANTRVERNRAYDVLEGHLPRPYFNLPTFNDVYGRKKEEVLAVFDKAIVSLPDSPSVTTKKE